MKRVLVAVFLVLVLAAGFYPAILSAQEKEPVAEQKDEGGMGITAGIEYYSDYLWRGTYYYGGEGAFYPYIGWDVLGTGINLFLAAEVGADYLFEGTGKETTGFGYHSVDFGLEYSKTFAELVTVGTEIYYWHYYNSKDTFGADASFLTAMVKVGFEVFLSPFIAFTYDYYVDEDYCLDGVNDRDFYLQAGIGHEFELTKEVKLGLGLAAGFYNAKSADISGISDINASAGIEVAAGIATITSSFNYVAVPTKDFYNYGAGVKHDQHRWFAVLGASVSL